MKKMFRCPNIAVVAVLTTAISVGATADPYPDAKAKVAELLGALHCEYRCETGDCRRGHKLRYVAGNEKAYHDQYLSAGEEDDCIGNGCSPYHDCDDPRLASQDIDTALDLIPTLSMVALLKLDQTMPRLIVHAGRQAVQVTGCGDKVLASVELTAAQRADLEFLAQ